MYSSISKLKKASSCTTDEIIYCFINKIYNKYLYSHFLSFDLYFFHHISVDFTLGSNRHKLSELSSQKLKATGTQIAENLMEVVCHNT